MKIKFSVISMFLTLLFILSLGITIISAEEDTSNSSHEHCYHGVIHDFDDETMTVNGVYEKNLVEARPAILNRTNKFRTMV